jgi:hypothetical protein
MKKHGTAKVLKGWVNRTLATALVMPWLVPAALASNTPLSLSQARSYIRGLELQVSDQKLTIRGQVFADCNGLFEIRSVSDPNHPNSFAILDTGGFATCMEAHASQSCILAANGACVDVTRELPLTGEGGDIHLLASISNGLENFERVGSFETDSAQRTRVAAEQARAERESADRERRAEAEARASRIRRLEQKVQGCRGDLDEISEARRAVGALHSLDEVDAERMNELLAELDEAEIEQFQRRIRRADGEDEIEELLEELVSFADSKCDRGEELEDLLDSAREEQMDALEEQEEQLARQVDQTAELFRQLAVKRVEVSRDESSEGSTRDPIRANRAAAAIVGEAQEIECLPRNTRRALSNYQRDLAVDRCTTIAQQGSAFAFDLQQCHQNLTAGLAQDVQRLCAGPAANGMECASARRAQMVVGQQIPQLVRQAQQREQQQWQQIQQQMMQSYSAPPATATSGIPLMPPSSTNLMWSGGAYGGS